MTCRSLVFPAYSHDSTSERYCFLLCGMTFFEINLAKIYISEAVEKEMNFVFCKTYT